MEINKNKVKKILTPSEGFSPLYPLLPNNTIVEIYLKNKLIQTCCECQFAKRKDLLKYYDDFYQDLILVLLLYDNEKMNDAHINNHFNALLTRIIQNNLNSTTSEFYRKYLRYDNNKEELTNKHKEIINED